MMSNEIKKMDVEFKLSLVSTEAVARAWASIDGKLNDFDACKADPELELEMGLYEGYVSDAESLLNRAYNFEDGAKK
jgi:hypothetical protein